MKIEEVSQSLFDVVSAKYCPATYGPHTTQVENIISPICLPLPRMKIDLQYGIPFLLTLKAIDRCKDE